MFYRTLAVLPALVGRVARPSAAGCRAASARTTTPLVDDTALTRPDLLAGREPRWINMSRLGEALTDPALDPPVRAMIVWNCQPAGDRAQRRADAPRARARRPVHRRPRAVPHRHGALRRHRAAGDHADRGHRRRHGLGAPLDRLERGRDRAARRGVQQHRAVPPTRRRDGLHRAGAVRRRQGAARAGARRDGRPRRAARASAGCGSPTRRTAGRSATGVFPTPSGKVELRQRAPGGDGPAGAADVRAAGRRTARRPRARRPLPAAADDAQAPHPLPQLQLLAAAQARPGRGRRRSSSSSPPTPRPGASPTATRPWCSTTGPASPCRCASASGVGPGSPRSRSAGGRASTPTVASANALTNDTLTEWGGGVAYSDTLVEVRPG